MSVLGSGNDMFTAREQQQWMGDRESFPVFSERLRLKNQTGELLLRGLDLSPAGLDIDFSIRPRPLLETRILACCTFSSDGTALEENFLWDLPVSTRTRCLLPIAALSSGFRQFDISLRCPHPSCGEELEISLSPKDIRGLAPEHIGDMVDIELSACTISLRLPSGRDQMHWNSKSFSGEIAAAQTMIRALAINKNVYEQLNGLGESEVREIGRALAKADPLVDFRTKAVCPECQKTGMHSLDLGAMALEHLRKVQFSLLHDVHELASAYSWTEAQILGLPRWRRSHYIKLLERVNG